MRSISIVVLSFISSILLAQKSEPVKLNYKDSIELVRTWKKFKLSLESRDTKILRSLSLKTVHCDLFQTPNPEATYKQDVDNAYITLNTFLAQFYYDLPKLKLWLVMKTKKYHIDVNNEVDFHLPNVKYQKTLKIYQIWYVTFEPNEIAQGHEGESEAFEFVKINGHFKFYGLTSIP